MTENQNIEKRNEGPIANIRNFLANVDVKSRLEDILGKRASAFGNSIVNVVSGGLHQVACSNQAHPLVNDHSIACLAGLLGTPGHWWRLESW